MNTPKATTESLRQEADRLYTELTDAMDAHQANSKKYRLRELDLKQEVVVQQAVGLAGRTYWAILRLLTTWQPLTDSRREIIEGRLDRLRDAIELAKSPVELRR
jgi:hypothetical protein